MFDDEAKLCRPADDTQTVEPVRIGVPGIVTNTREQLMSTHHESQAKESGGEWPAWRDLFYGAVREALASVYSVGRIGNQDTRAWERPLRYVADDNQGNVGVVEFRVDGAVGAVSARCPERAFDWARAIDLAPAALRESLAQLCRLPLLQEGQGVSTAFWTVGESLRGPENWHATCLSGGELFRRELLSDFAWEKEAKAHYDLPLDLARLVMEIGRRAALREPMLALSKCEVRHLIPRDAAYEGEALGLLTSDGLFGIAPDIVRL
ncbi:MAG: hypothetical protein JNL21_19925 [Myxococcales bacterium]|nr:hypothetical protein [Myxococcales bacterium]